MKYAKFLSEIESDRNLRVTDHSYPHRTQVLNKVGTHFYNIGKVNTTIELYIRALSLCPEKCIIHRGGTVVTICTLFYQKGNIASFDKYSRLMPKVPKDGTCLPSEVVEMRKFVGQLSSQIRDSENMKRVRREFKIMSKKREKIKICQCCGAKERNKSMKKCAGCKFFFYCSRKCQKKDWKEHKEYCVDLMTI